MAYQKSHGLQLAENAVIKNFGVERVAIDPIITEAGRCWFNETSKQYKYTTLDAGGAVQVRTFANYEELTAFVALIASAAGAGEVGTSAFVSANSKVDVVAGTVQSALVGIAADVDAQLVANDVELAAFDLQRAYDQTIADGSGDAVIKLITGKDLKIEDDTNTTVFFKVDSETGTVTITGNLEVAGASTSIESTITSGDHWLITPDAATTVALNIEPDALVVMVADLVNIKTAFGAASSFRVTSGGEVIADGRNIAADGTILDAHLNGLAGKHAATEVSYDNFVSDLTAVNVKDALDEIQNTLGGAGGTSVGDQLANIQDYTGAVDGVDTDPQYSSTNYVVQGINITAAVSSLDVQAKVNETAIVANDGDISTLGTSLAQEVSDRAGADALLQAELDATQTGAGLAAAGGYVATVGSNYLAAATSLNNADLKLDAQSKVNADATATETTNRISAVAGVQAEVDATQVGAGLGADGGYVANVTAVYIDGATSLANSDNLLDAATKVNEDAIGPLTSLTTANTTNLVNAINEVAVTAGAGTDTLVAAINSQKFRSSSVVPAATHTIAHSLGSIEISVSVWVMSDDLKWRNDLVPITIVDANSIVIELTEARNVKVVIENEEDIVLV